MRWTAVLIGAGCTLLPALAFAEDAPPPTPPIANEPQVTITSTAEDTVYLRGGGMMRGTIEEVLPGAHVTIALPTGELRSVPWTDVARVVIGNAPGAATAIQVEAAPVVVAITGPLARVHVASTKLVQLFRRPAGTKDWTQACHSPCDLDLPLGDEYRVSGSSMTPSSNFRLHGAPGDRITITVRPTSTAGVAIGGVVAGVGGTAMYVGLFGAWGLVREDSTRYTALGVGAVVVAIGVTIMVASAGTSASQTAVAKKDAVRSDAFVREPSWLRPQVTASAPMALPIFRGAF